uniref:Uncharacterized protein n=1 Tax=Cannabis sativa TaxID=3483 RepID=A0A803PFE2_CANSA
MKWVGVASLTGRDFEMPEDSLDLEHSNLADSFSSAGLRSNTRHFFGGKDGGDTNIISLSNSSTFEHAPDRISHLSVLHGERPLDSNSGSGGGNIWFLDSNAPVLGHGSSGDWWSMGIIKGYPFSFVSVSDHRSDHNKGGEVRCKVQKLINCLLKALVRVIAMGLIFINWGGVELERSNGFFSNWDLTGTRKVPKLIGDELGKLGGFLAKRNVVSLDPERDEIELIWCEGVKAFWIGEDHEAFVEVPRDSGWETESPCLSRGFLDPVGLRIFRSENFDNETVGIGGYFRVKGNMIEDMDEVFFFSE